MKLNNFTLVGFSEDFNQVTFVLADITLEQAIGLDGETLSITNDENEIQKVFMGYSVVSVGYQGDYVTINCIRQLNDQVASAINGLEANLNTFQNKIDGMNVENLEGSLQTLQIKVDSIDYAIQGINNTLSTISQQQTPSKPVEEVVTNQPEESQESGTSAE